eukprot:GSA120T00021179001.1
MQNYSYFLNQAMKSSTDLRDFPQEAVLDYNIVKHAVGNNPRAFQFSSVHCRDSLEIALLAVGKEGLMLEFASARLKESNRDLVLAAVRQNGLSLQFVVENLHHGSRLRQEQDRGLHEQEMNPRHYREE